MSKSLLRALAVATGCAVLFSAARAETITVGPYTPTYSSPTPTPFIVPILVTGAVRLDSFSFSVDYDASAYMINTGCDAFSGDAYCDIVTGPVTLGTFYSGSSYPVFDPGFIYLDPTTGDQTGHLDSVTGLSDSDPPPSGDGVLAFIELIALNDSLPAGTITITGAPSAPPDPGTPSQVPEPASFLLMSAGLVIGWTRTRRRSS